MKEVAERKQMRSRTIDMRNIALAGVATIVSLIAAELGLRFINYPPEPKWGWQWNDSPYHDTRFTSDQVNDLGLRGQPITYSGHDFVVALVGDSMVEEGAQEQAVQPERILEYALRQYGLPAKVFSIASAGWSLDQELLALQRYFARHRADMVVHWLVPFNDFWEAGDIDRSETEVPGPLKPTFLLRDGNLSVYSVSAFRFKVWHLLRLALSRMRDEHWGNSSIAIHSYEKTLPSAGRVPIPADQCPPGPTLPSNERIAIPGLVPLTDRDRYFVELEHALQVEIEQLATKHRAGYLPFTVADKPALEGLGTVHCIISHDHYYRFDVANYYRMEQNPRIAAALNIINLEQQSRSYYVSKSDYHLNIFGNFPVLNQLARLMAEQRTGRKTELIPTDDLIVRSGMPLPPQQTEQ